jgi:hypothetical protein
LTAVGVVPSENDARFAELVASAAELSRYGFSLILKTKGLSHRMTVYDGEIFPDGGVFRAMLAMGVEEDVIVIVEQSIPCEFLFFQGNDNVH